MAQPKKSKSIQAEFNVPNNDEGKVFIESLRKYVNRNNFGIRVRARGSRTRVHQTTGNHYQDWSIKQSEAEWFQVYVDGKITWKVNRKFLEKLLD